MKIKLICNGSLGYICEIQQKIIADFSIFWIEDNKEEIKNSVSREKDSNGKKSPKSKSIQ